MYRLRDLEARSDSIRARSVAPELLRTIIQLWSHSTGLVLDAPEYQIDPWPSDGWLFRDLVLVVLGVSPHNQQASVGQPFRKFSRAIGVAR